MSDITNSNSDETIISTTCRKYDPGPDECLCSEYLCSAAALIKSFEINLPSIGILPISHQLSCQSVSAGAHLDFPSADEAGQYLLRGGQAFDLHIIKNI